MCYQKAVFTIIDECFEDEMVSVPDIENQIP